MPRSLRLLSLVILLVTATRVTAAEIVWTRMTGQYMVCNAPLVTDLDQDGAPDVVAVNRIGQVMRWGLEGQDGGPGQDGTVFQLPDGDWNSSPRRIDRPQGLGVLLVNKAGLVVLLDASLSKILWQAQLPGTTNFGRALPTLLATPKGPGLCFGDEKGSVTCLSLEGKELWKTELKTGAVRAEIQVFTPEHGEPILLAPVGSALHALDASGKVLWSHELGGEIRTRPEFWTCGGKRAVVCGGEQLAALTPERGEVVWSRTLEGQIDATLGILPRGKEPSLLTYTAVWGNLYACDSMGKPVWQSQVHSKMRGRPFLCDIDGDGRSEIFLAAYNQHLYEFNDQGMLLDDLRLEGLINATPVAIQPAGQAHPDLLLVTENKLAYRIRPSVPRSPYGETGKPEGVAITPPSPQAPRTLLIDNPHGALLRVNVASQTKQAGMLIQGVLTARSRFEVTLPEEAAPFRATVDDAAGHRLVERVQESLPAAAAATPVAADAIGLWAVPAYASFDPAQVTPTGTEPKAVEVRSLYQKEYDQAALVAVATTKEPLRARVILGPLATADKTPFAGHVTLREVVMTGTVNGEKAADALPALDDAGLVMLLPGEATKIWLSVDAQEAKPGIYEGTISVQPLAYTPAVATIPVRIEVLPLVLQRPFPLKYCTWDYVPNNWFPDQTEAVLDDMARHGVNIWPRSEGVPPARAEADGRLVFDWGTLNVALDRFKGRGEILFHIVHPPITFATPPSPEAKHQAELTYLRTWRDYMRDHGWGYDQYAFYPIDEPGLDNGKASVPALLEAAKLFREADPKLRIYTDPVPGLCLADFRKIEPLIDVWCPNMRLVTGLLSGDPRIESILKSKKPVWSYECVSQVRSLSPLRYNRANAWRGNFFGLSGIGTWTHCTMPTDMWLPGKTHDDEYCLVYPGKLPVPSARWEAARDGLEDIAAVVLLEQAIAKAPASKAELVAQAREALRIARIDILELSDLAFVEGRDFLRAGDRRLWHTATDVETYARHRARVAELTLALQNP